ncbi:helix-turn-helix domain-containing protein [Streptomyces sp. NPDC050504]|uniref:helix-turn-helix transcriptional regulator n=1 Tax=Streptomyces sp. NPDC050504 TaxID=3365618 RepID=UPI0037A526EF
MAETALRPVRDDRAGVPGGLLADAGARAFAVPLADEDFIAEGGHPPHVHDFHQFLYVPVGRIVVSARGRDHELSASVALWIPAGLPHSARFDSESLIVVENFDADLFALPHSDAAALNVTGAQRRLLLARMRSTGAAENDPEVFAALRTEHPAALPLPRPTSRTAALVAQELARTPSDARTATEWAAELYTSSTSLRRAFRAETGMAFSEWRTRLRLNHSLGLLEQGQLVGAVAARVGFVSTNGYILAFRRYFGQTPGAFVKRHLDHSA